MNSFDKTLTALQSFKDDHHELDLRITLLIREATVRTFVKLCPTCQPLRFVYLTEKRYTICVWILSDSLVLGSIIGEKAA